MPYPMAAARGGRIQIRPGDDVIVLDDTLSGTGAIADHVPAIRPVGAAWNIVKGTFAVPNIQSGELCWSTGSFGAAIINVGISNVQIDAYVRTGQGGFGHEVGIVARSTADGTDRLVISPDSYNNNIYLHRVTNDAETVLSGDESGLTIADTTY